MSQQQSCIISFKTSRIVTATLALLVFLLISQPFSTAAKDRSEAKKNRPAAKKARPDTPFDIGVWTDAYDTAPGIHLSVLPDGRVFTWTQLWTTMWRTYARTWNPSNPTAPLPEFNYNGHDLFCSGHSFMWNGKLLVTGGTKDKPGPQPGGIDWGSPKSAIFDFATNSWQDTNTDMNKGRWYPTNVALGTGETLVMSGSYKDENDATVVNTLPQLWGVNGGWTDLTGATVPLSFPLYPWLHLASDGRVFYSGPKEDSMFINTTPPGTLTPGPTSGVPFREEGSSVMYDVDKVLIAGGDSPPTNTAEMINLAPQPPTVACPFPPCWKSAGTMRDARRHLNLTILADGSVLATGGTKGGGANNPCTYNQVKAAEIWNPGAPQVWKPMAEMKRPRLYHSTAVLLTDGRVLVSGGTVAASIDICKEVPLQQVTEIFSPPYLFNPDGTPAARPSIGVAPAETIYGQDFNVQLSGLGTDIINRVTLVRLSSTTHSFNQNQRFNNLTFTRRRGTLTVNMPSNKNACPPGHYMLFVINEQGVPSEARIIRVRRQGEARQANQS